MPCAINDLEIPSGTFLAGLRDAFAGPLSPLRCFQQGLHLVVPFKILRDELKDHKELGTGARVPSKACSIPEQHCVLDPPCTVWSSIPGSHDAPLHLTPLFTCARLAWWVFGQCGVAPPLSLYLHKGQSATSQGPCS